MNNQQVENIMQQLNLRETEDLIKIWQEHDQTQWTNEALEAIRLILLSRTGETPPFEDRAIADKYIKQADDLLEDNELDKAMEQINLAIQSAPHYGYAYFCKGTVFDEMGKLEDAINLYKEALRISPNLTNAKRNLHWALDELSQKTTNREERIMAGLAHVSILIFPMGLLVPIIAWITQKEKSYYVAFQTFQAMLFQFIAFCIQVLGGLCFLIYFIALATVRYHRS